MFDTPMRYPGGKGRLAQYVINVLQLNDIVGGQYAEPYAGGAGVAIPLLYLEYAERVHLNDISRSVYSFWKSVCDEPEGLCRLIRNTRVSVAQWKRQRSIQKAADPTILELGFSTLFLNRTNRSGIITGGIIGGLDQSGPWKIDARFNRDELVRRVQKIASYAPRISLYNLDALAFLKTVLPTIPAKSLVYLDPPYYAKGSDLYENFYKPKDHATLASAISKIKQKWMISYDNAPAVRALYAKFEQQTFDLQYTAQSRYKGTEVMVFCPKLKTPASIVPWRGMAA